MKPLPDLAAHKASRSDGSWETYWRAGFVADGQPPIIVETYCRREAEANEIAEKAAREHHAALVDVGVFVEVRAFTQQWKTRSRGNLEEYQEATNALVLHPPEGIRPAEAIERARERRSPDLRSLST